ncbi:MAG: aminopeptidase P family protein [Bacteroidales bacterium]
MFEKQVYLERRNRLRSKVKDGIILLMGNADSPMNYSSNTYHFRQDSTFLYFCGLDFQNLAAVVDVDNNQDIIFGDDLTLDDIIWMGPQPSMQQRAAQVGVDHTAPYSQLTEVVQEALKKGRKVHFLPPYRADNKILLDNMLNIPPDQQKQQASEELIRAVVDLRSVKDEHEIAALEKVMDVAYEMHTTAMKMAKPGMVEHQLAGALEGIAISHGGHLSFPLILTVHGETLHNHYHGNKLQQGQLLLIDGGAESEMRYASDHTRTIPVGGKFSDRQKEIYQIVLDAQMRAIEAIKPGVTFKSIHMLAAKVIATGLKELGLMKGDLDAAVQQGAHALFMPHGLGHMMGLDVHDMEDLGENYVGYDDEVKRSDLFGTGFLRLGRKLQTGFVVTVEPGTYFIPALIEKWEKENKFTEFINYDKVKEYLDFGGIRIEDDILVTDQGYRVLGKPIPKTIKDIENFMGGVDTHLGHA